ncbi:hypothetical protein QYZ88_008275 [Lachnospiraceae bacterium C1.1]|nr:hypothetical protein [Lachnospiraceae bacterium C1.1]
MTKLTMYKCDVCGKCYETEKEALDCEARDYATDAQATGRYKTLEENMDKDLDENGTVD